MKRSDPYDHTRSARSAARRARAAAALPSITLDPEHTQCLHYLLDETGLSPTALVRQLLREEAVRRGAPIAPRTE